MLLAELLHGPWTLGLSPMWSVFKLLLSEVPVWEGRRGLNVYTILFLQMSPWCIWRSYIVLWLLRASRCNHYCCVPFSAHLMAAGGRGGCNSFNTICNQLHGIPHGRACLPVFTLDLLSRLLESLRQRCYNKVQCSRWQWRWCVLQSGDDIRLRTEQSRPRKGQKSQEWGWIKTDE